MTAVIGLLVPPAILIAARGACWLIGRCRASARAHRAAVEQALWDAAFGRIVAELTGEGR